MTVAPLCDQGRWRLLDACLGGQGMAGSDSSPAPRTTLRRGGHSIRYGGGASSDTGPPPRRASEMPTRLPEDTELRTRAEFS